MKENGNGTRLMIYKKFKNHNKLVDTKKNNKKYFKKKFWYRKIK